MAHTQDIAVGVNDIDVIENNIAPLGNGPAELHDSAVAALPGNNIVSPDIPGSRDDIVGGIHIEEIFDGVGAVTDAGRAVTIGPADRLAVLHHFFR